jgi:exonuclease III
LDVRKDKLEQTISESNADFICLQEMSEYSYYTLKDTIDKYKYVSERPYIKQISRKRNADVYFMSKYKPSKITIYSLFGILGYNNSMLIVEYNNLIIINVYLQSGSKKSPGQLESNLVKRFSECRIKQLNVIYDIIKTYDKQNKNIVLCGDFNFHLDGNLDEWPENEIINKFKNDGFIDTYRDINPLLNGFTEDTDTNMLRYNMKLIDKQYRFDGIFYLLGLKLQDSDLKLYKNKISSNLIGQNTFYLDVNDSKWFINNIKGFRDNMGTYLTRTRAWVYIAFYDEYVGRHINTCLLCTSTRPSSSSCSCQADQDQHRRRHRDRDAEARPVGR